MLCASLGYMWSITVTSTLFNKIFIMVMKRYCLLSVCYNLQYVLLSYTWSKSAKQSKFCECVIYARYIVYCCPIGNGIYIISFMSSVKCVYYLNFYLFFRKARRGLLTTILLHLCTSIICLTCVLYITAAIESSKIGCRIANMTRTYFILVSLMWNAVEARNMYRNLIKVFVNTGDRFIYKAAAAAWSKFSLFF